MFSKTSSGEANRKAEGVFQRPVKGGAIKRALIFDVSVLVDRGGALKNSD